MPTRDSDHVVAIDFSPHTEAMQTDALLETGTRSAGGQPGLGSGPKNMAACVLVVVVVVCLIFWVASL